MTENFEVFLTEDSSGRPVYCTNKNIHWENIDVYSALGRIKDVNGNVIYLEEIINNSDFQVGRYLETKVRCPSLSKEIIRKLEISRELRRKAEDIQLHMGFFDWTFGGPACRLWLSTMDRANNIGEEAIKEAQEAVTVDVTVRFLVKAIDFRDECIHVIYENEAGPAPIEGAYLFNAGTL